MCWDTPCWVLLDKDPLGRTMWEICPEQKPCCCHTPSTCTHTPSCWQQNLRFRTVLSKIFQRAAHAVDRSLKVFWCGSLISRCAWLPHLSCIDLKSLTWSLSISMLLWDCSIPAQLREWHITGMFPDSFRAQVSVCVKANKQKT